MEYEFKEYIRDEILSNINHMNILDDALDELDYVYAQAAKADDYEAKAKAFDEIMNIFKRNGIDKLDYSECPREICDFYEDYESGESDE